MSQHYRHRLPRWLNKCIFILEQAIIPILIFQLIRTLLFMTFIELMLLTLIIVIFMAFYLRWI